jgi:hypothetical protein
MKRLAGIGIAAVATIAALAVPHLMQALKARAGGAL